MLYRIFAIASKSFCVRGPCLEVVEITLRKYKAISWVLVRDNTKGPRIETNQAENGQRGYEVTDK
eukprot:6057365-Amphidinium_carterae.1